MFSYIVIALSVCLCVEASKLVTPSALPVPCVPGHFEEYAGSSFQNIWENYLRDDVPRTIILSRGIGDLVPQDAPNPLYVPSGFSKGIIMDYLSLDHFDCEEFKPDATVTLNTMSGKKWKIVNGTEGILTVNGALVTVPPKRLYYDRTCVLQISDVLFDHKEQTDKAFKLELRNNPPSTSFLGNK